MSRYLLLHDNHHVVVPSQSLWYFVLLSSVYGFLYI